MKRRLDLALALVHMPRILFLDEPTTGLDPQSRTALWEEVARLRREEGVTVFLTTQYLEEADVLADRVGIIDQGKIVAEGTPAELKAEIGRPSVHAIPRDEKDRPKIAEFLARFGEPLATTRDVAVRLRDGLGLTDIVRAVDANGVDIVDLELRAPSLDDVFLAKTGRTLEGAAGGGRAEHRQRRLVSSSWPQVGAIARRSVVRTARQPASVIPPLVFPIALMTVNAAGLQASTELPGFPTDSFLAFALAVPFIQGALFSTMNAGTDLARDIQTGFINRLSLTALRDWALLLGQISGVVVLGVFQAIFYLVVGLASGVEFATGPGRDRGAALLRGDRLTGVRCARRLARLQDGLGRGDPGPLPRPVRVPLHLLDEHATRPDRRAVVPDGRDAESGLVHDRARPQPDHRGLERAGARPRVRLHDPDRGHLDRARLARAANADDEDVVV